jgi:protoporphyrinogen oxidase
VTEGGGAVGPRQPRRVAVVGAGIGGMAAAYDLARAGHQVVVFEAADHVGGLAAGFRDSGWDWSVERFYHHWFASDNHMLGLIDELGLSDRVLFPRPYTVVYHNGGFYPFDSIPQALMFPGLGWGLNKVRFGLVGLYLRLTNNWRGLEQHTADAWMRRWAGSTVYEKMWQPLLQGKFGPYYKDVNMAWMWARIKARTTRLGTFEGGFQAFSDALADHLRGLGVEIRLNTPIQAISKNEGPGLSVAAASGSESWDQVLATTSPGLLARLAPGLKQEYLKGLLDLKSMGAVVMIVALKHQLSEKGYYWYNIPKAAGFPFLALVEHTNYLTPDHFGGDHIVYMGDYLEQDHEYFDLSEAELLERFLPVLPRFNKKFERDWVRKTWLFRTKYAQPVPLVNHSRYIPDIQTPLEGLYFASMSQVYPWDRGTNFAVEIGRRAAAIMSS